MIIKRKRNRHFAVIPNAMLDDERLSVEAKGLHAYLLSRPADWEVRHDQLQRHLNIGRRRFDKMVAELIKAGYMERDEEQGRDPRNRFTTYNYVVRDEPEPKSADEHRADQSLGDSSSAPPNFAGVHSAQRSAPLRKMYTGTKKEETKTDSIKPPDPPQANAASGAAARQPRRKRDKTERFVDVGLAAIQTFVDQHSEPWRAWCAYRQANGNRASPPVKHEMVDGHMRPGWWMPSLWPPGHGGQLDMLADHLAKRECGEDRGPGPSMAAHVASNSHPGG